jgi:CDP-diglyceride synthetase
MGGNYTFGTVLGSGHISCNKTVEAVHTNVIFAILVIGIVGVMIHYMFTKLSQNSSNIGICATIASEALTLTLSHWERELGRALNPSPSPSGRG